jgi:hypothetical protein
MMMSFQQFDEQAILTKFQDITEQMITLGGKAYPKFGNVVIMAGGGGSGKGFILGSLLGMEGKVFDVDELKKLASKAPKIVKTAKDEYGVDIQKLASNLGNPQNVSDLHDVFGGAPAKSLGGKTGMNVGGRKEALMFASIIAAPAERKPNLIFDTTLANPGKLKSLAEQLTNLGYERKNIHIVWVVQDLKVAYALNKKRERMVPLVALFGTHKGAATTMKEVMKMGEGLSKMIDGDIVLVFNKVEMKAEDKPVLGPSAGKDSELIKSTLPKKSVFGRKPSTGSYIAKGSATIEYIKNQGETIKTLDQFKAGILDKIKAYVPRDSGWVD